MKFTTIVIKRKRKRKRKRKMGCSQSKIEYKVEVLQCKIHKDYLKKAIASRNAFAEAHSAYSISLRNIGIVLSDYGQGENHLLLPPSDNKVDKVETSRKKEKQKVVHSSNLSQVLDQLDDHFFKSFESARDVLELLEPTRMHHHSNSAHSNGQFEYSARVAPVITLSLSCKRLKEENERVNDLDSHEPETYAAILSKMLGWEKKLYEEVKASELMKFKYQEKIATLYKQKKSSTIGKALEKTKAAVRYSCTRYIVRMNSLDFTVSEINRLQEKQLCPKLFELVDAMEKMWQTMFAHHSSQLKIACNLKKLDVSLAAKGTSYQLFKRTQRLVNVFSEWHVRLQNLIKYQKQHVQAMNKWINLIPIENNSKGFAPSPLKTLLREWHELLETISDEQVLDVIHTFVEVMKSVLVLQEDEIRMKEKCEDTKREYKKKSREFDAWCKQHKENDANEGEEHDEVIEERKRQVESLKTKLEEEEDLYQHACKHTREKSVQSLMTHLPELFIVLSEFASDCLEMYQRLST